MELSQFPTPIGSYIGETNYGYSHENDPIPFPNGIEVASENIPTPPLQKFAVPDGNVQHLAVGKKSGRIAVYVDGGKKSFGNFDVLKGVYMAVHEGTIYGLLGSSGCGKTTLLSCIVALKKLDSGRILVYGKEPGTKGAGVPGSLVGYMPQEVALNEEFTMAEVCQYFGRLYGMDAQRVRERMKSLVDLLDLKKCYGRLSTFSGGQKRRASFIIALLHEPDILILDEPTVGVDPILRSKIWTHIRNLADSFGTTIIITTHYIEEMRHADRIGIMQYGQLMAESSPQNLMAYHNATMLEDVVLNYCVRSKKEPTRALQNSQARRNSLSFDHPYNNGGIEDQNKMSTSANIEKTYSGNLGRDIAILQSQVDRSGKSTHPINRIKALTKKNITVLMRNVLFLLFLLAVPALIVLCYGIAVGHDPKNLSVGIINEESGTECNQSMTISKCEAKDLACAFSNYLNSSVTLQIEKFATTQAALNAVQNQISRVWGYIHLGSNFSHNIFERTVLHRINNERINNERINNEIIDGSNINVRLDVSSIYTGQYLKRTILETYKTFSLQLLAVCNINTAGQELPVEVGEPVYGSDTNKHNLFIIPGVVIGFLPFLSCVACAISYILEKKDGMLDRTKVAGVTAFDIILSHAIPQFGIVILQTLLAFAFMYILNVPLNTGSPVLAFLLTVTAAAEGMAMGFAAAEVFDEEKNAMLFTMAILFPCFLISGLIWPIESLAPYLQIVSYFLPATMPARGLRSILFRGWGLSKFDVWMSFVSQFIFIAIFAAIAFVVHKIKK